MRTKAIMCPVRGYPSFIEECEEKYTLKWIVDLNGSLIAKDVEINPMRIIQGDLYGDDREPDDEDFGGSTGYEGAEATHWYRDMVSSKSLDSFAQPQI